ncbi:MAG: S1 RNA-binding domain-containing protein [Clostridia bacterium]|jgi:hypothetical protein|nr:S1 RNA-binding domain-containing protein [Clostridia bacterium]
MKSYTVEAIGTVPETMGDVFLAWRSGGILRLTALWYDAEERILHLALPEGRTALLPREEGEGEYAFRSLVGTDVSVRIKDQCSETQFLCEKQSVTRQREVLLYSLSPGTLVKGATVVSMVGYGAFLDLGGIMGLLHVKEMEGLPKHPSEKVAFLDKLDVVVKKVDLQAKLVYLTQNMECRPSVKDQLTFTLQRLVG